MIHAIEPAVVVEHAEDFELVVGEGISRCTCYHCDEAGGHKPRRAPGVVDDVVVVLFRGEGVGVTEGESLDEI